jgi:hypothetical protein
MQEGMLKAANEILQEKVLIISSQTLIISISMISS